MMYNSPEQRFRVIAMNIHNAVIYVYMYVNKAIGKCVRVCVLNSRVSPGFLLEYQTNLFISLCVVLRAFAYYARL